MIIIRNFFDEFNKNNDESNKFNDESDVFKFDEFDFDSDESDFMQLNLDDKSDVSDDILILMFLNLFYRNLHMFIYLFFQYKKKSHIIIIKNFNFLLKYKCFEF